jgi:regulator of nucleoside diphosphate kinase
MSYHYPHDVGKIVPAKRANSHAGGLPRDSQISGDGEKQVATLRRTERHADARRGTRHDRPRHQQFKQENAMIEFPCGYERAPVHLLASESDVVASLALQSERRQPIVAAVLLEEIERAELHDPETMPQGHAGLKSRVTFVDERSAEIRELQLVMPAEADVAEGRISILTPLGAALYGLAAGACISWPDLDGNERPIRIMRVEALPEQR